MDIQKEWELHKPKKKTWGRLLRPVFGLSLIHIYAADE